MPREREVGTKVTFNSEDFNKYFKANLKQNCKHIYIPQAQADYVTDKLLTNAIDGFKVSQDFENNGIKYTLDFEGSVGGRSNLNYNTEANSGDSTMYYRFFVIIYKGGKKVDARTEFFDVLIFNFSLLQSTIMFMMANVIFMGNLC
jgi:hypothetical protein